MNTLTQIFDWLLAASARASLLTVVVLIAQALLRHRVPARWLYALWLPVLLVLLVPVFPESPWSVASIVQASPARAPLLAPKVIESNATLPLLAASSTTKGHQPINGSQVMLLTWCIGAVGLLLLGAGSLAGSLWQIKRTRLPMSKAWLDGLAQLACEIGLRRPPLVLVARSIRGPAVTGFLRPTLLLPAHFEETLTPQEARLVLKHELTHIKRGDLPLNALLCVLLALHWFNPLLWIAFYKARHDREAACDAQVLDHENQAQRVAYGHTLLKVETAFSHYRLSLGFVGIFQRGTALRSRIRSIAISPKEHPFVKTLLGLGIVLLTFLGITKAATPDAAAPQVVIDAKFIELSDNSASPSVSAELPDLLKAGASSPGLRGVLDDPQFQQIIRQLSQRKGTDLLSSPRVTTLAGQVAKIEVGREMAYMDEDGKPATKTVGVTLTALPRAKGNDQFEVELSPQVVEFEEFLKSKSGKERPIFRERKVTVKVVMQSGQTSVLELAPALDKQVVEEADAQGRTISSRTDTITRRTFVFVTTRLVAPSKGNATKPNSQAGRTSIQEKLDTIILPSAEFSETSLSEAVEFLRVQSSKLDTATQDPKLKGVNFIIKREVSASEPKITLNLKNVTLGQAANYIAELSGCKLWVQPNAVALLAPAEYEAAQKSAAISSEPMFILPSVVFDNATLVEVVNFVRLKSQEVDPTKRGLNIVLQHGCDLSAKFSLSLKNVPAEVVLRYCAELTKHKLTVEEGVYVIRP